VVIVVSIEDIKCNPHGCAIPANDIHGRHCLTVEYKDKSRARENQEGKKIIQQKKKQEKEKKKNV